MASHDSSITALFKNSHSILWLLWAGIIAYSLFCFLQWPPWCFLYCRYLCQKVPWSPYSISPPSFWAHSLTWSWVGTCDWIFASKIYSEVMYDKSPTWRYAGKFPVYSQMYLLSSSSDVYYSFFQVPFPSGLWVGSSNGRNWLKIGVWEEREARIYFVFFLSLFPMASLLTAIFSHGSMSTGQGPTILLDILGSWTLVKISTSHCHTSFGMKVATRCCSVQWPLCPLFGICRTEIIMLAPQE